jgi:Ribonuclease III
LTCCPLLFPNSQTAIQNQSGSILRVERPSSEALTRILTSKDFAQFGDALLNFAYSLAITERTGKPRGVRVPDKALAEAAVKAGLRKLLPRRVGRGDIANGLEALLGYSWLEETLTLDEIVKCLKAEALAPADNFAKLAQLALSKLKQ